MGAAVAQYARPGCPLLYNFFFRFATKMSKREIAAAAAKKYVLSPDNATANPPADRFHSVITLITLGKAEEGENINREKFLQAILTEFFIEYPILAVPDAITDPQSVVVTVAPSSRSPASQQQGSCSLRRSKPSQLPPLRSVAAPSISTTPSSPGSSATTTASPTSTSPTTNPALISIARRATPTPLQRLSASSRWLQWWGGRREARQKPRSVPEDRQRTATRETSSR